VDGNNDQGKLSPGLGRDVIHAEQHEAIHSFMCVAASLIAEVDATSCTGDK